MGLRETLVRHLPHRIEANALPFGGDDGDGYSVVDFTPSVVETIRLGASVAAVDGLYRTQPAVRTCVSFLAESIAPLNLKVFRANPNGAPIRLYDHPLNTLLQNPSPTSTRFELMRDTVSDLALYGNGYWIKLRDGGTRAVVRMPPRFIRPEGGSVVSGPARYLLQNGETGEETAISIGRVVHFRGYNPIDSRIGISPLEALRYVLNEDYEASKHRQWFWKNHAGREGVIQRPLDSPEWDDTSRDRFRADWQAKFSGSASAGTTPILEDGMTWHDSSFSPKDSEFIEGREYTLDTVATAYHIPLMVLSRKGTATFASAKEFHKMLYVDTLGPWNAMMEGAIKLQLVSDFDDNEGVYVEFNIDEKLQGDFEEQTNAARQSVQVPWMSVDDMRAKRGMPPLGGVYGDPARPSNYLYGDQQPEGIEPTETDEADDDDLLELAASNGYREIDSELIGTREELT